MMKLLMVSAGIYFSTFCLQAMEKVREPQNEYKYFLKEGIFNNVYQGKIPLQLLVYPFEEKIRKAKNEKEREVVKEQFKEILFNSSLYCQKKWINSKCFMENFLQRDLEENCFTSKKVCLLELLPSLLFRIKADKDNTALKNSLCLRNANLQNELIYTYNHPLEPIVVFRESYTVTYFGQIQQFLKSGCMINNTWYNDENHICNKTGKRSYYQANGVDSISYEPVCASPSDVAVRFFKVMLQPKVPTTMSYSDASYITLLCLKRLTKDKKIKIPRPITDLILKRVALENACASVKNSVHVYKEFIKDQKYQEKDYVDDFFCNDFDQWYEDTLNKCRNFNK